MRAEFGTGFNEKTLGILHRKLTKLSCNPRSPYADLSGTTGDARDVSWVKPVLVAEVEFSNWTNERLLRHPSFQGLREDKPAGKVIHDEPISLSEVKAMENGPQGAPPPATEPHPKKVRPKSNLQPAAGPSCRRRRRICRSPPYPIPRQGPLSRPGINEARPGQLLFAGRRLDSAPRHRSSAGNRSVPRRQRRALFFSKASGRRRIELFAAGERLPGRPARISSGDRECRRLDRSRSDGCP